MKFEFTINDEPNTIEEPRKRPCKFVPRTDKELSDHISEDMRRNSDRRIYASMTRVSLAEYLSVKERVLKLPEQHNDFEDFLNSWWAIRSIHRNFRHYFFSRIEELEELSSVAA